MKKYDPIAIFEELQTSNDAVAALKSSILNLSKDKNVVGGKSFAGFVLYQLKVRACWARSTSPLTCIREYSVGVSLLRQHFKQELAKYPEGFVDLL